MNLLSYQRTVFGFHGCDRRLANDVLTGKLKLSASMNTYDWLGMGIYFWENGPSRALEWAVQQSKRKGSHIKQPAVLGAIIQLSGCLDLLDIQYTRELADAAADLEGLLTAQGIPLPQNQTVGVHDFDWLRRERDSFVLNSVIPTLEEVSGTTYHTVRGVFQEGQPAFSGAGIKLKSHIQIAVRDPSAIIGYFKPEGMLT